MIFMYLSWCVCVRQSKIDICTMCICLNKLNKLTDTIICSPCVQLSIIASSPRTCEENKLWAAQICFFHHPLHLVTTKATVGGSSVECHWLLLSSRLWQLWRPPWRRPTPRLRGRTSLAQASLDQIWTKSCNFRGENYHTISFGWNGNYSNHFHSKGSTTTQ